MNLVLNEKSKLFRPGYLISFLPVMIILSTLLIKEYGEEDTLGTILALCGLMINLLVLAIMQLYRLELNIDENGIQYKYKPHHHSFVVCNWDEITEVKVVKFDPLQDFRGWGKKTSVVYGTGYLTHGDTGIFIKDSKGREITLSLTNVKKAGEMISLYKI